MATQATRSAAKVRQTASKSKTASRSPANDMYVGRQFALVPPANDIYVGRQSALVPPANDIYVGRQFALVPPACDIYANWSPWCHPCWPRPTMDLREDKFEADGPVPAQRCAQRPLDASHGCPRNSRSTSRATRSRGFCFYTI